MTNLSSPAKKGASLRFARNSPLEHYLFQHFEERTIEGLGRKHLC